MKPKRIILIRHGEAESNVDKLFYGQKPDYTSSLTAKGLEQAYDAGQELKALLGDESAFFYVSPYWRTRMTFEQIFTHFSPEKIQYREEPRLREQEWGHIREMDNSKVVNQKRNSFGTFYFRLPEGESAADVYDRVSDFFGTLYRDFAKEQFADNAVIVSHGMTIRVFLMKWFHWTVEEFEEYGNPVNCQIIILEQGEDAKYRLVSDLKKHTVFHNYQRPLQLK